MHTEASERSWYTERETSESAQRRERMEQRDRFHHAQNALASGEYLTDAERRMHEETIQEITHLPQSEPARDYLNEF